VNGILIEYEGEDSGIGLLFASKAAVQVTLQAKLVEFWSELGTVTFESVKKHQCMLTI